MKVKFKSLFAATKSIEADRLPDVASELNNENALPDSIKYLMTFTGRTR